MQEQLPVGFISVDDAIKLINSDTRSDAKVDTQFLLNNLPFLREDTNYNIKKLKTIKTPAGPRHEKNGCVFVHISNEYEKAILEHAIVEHYKEMSRTNIDPRQIGVHKVTTEVGTNNGYSGQPRDNSDTTLESSVSFDQDLGKGKLV